MYGVSYSNLDYLGQNDFLGHNTFIIPEGYAGYDNILAHPKHEVGHYVQLGGNSYPTVDPIGGYILGLTNTWDMGDHGSYIEFPNIHTVLEFFKMQFHSSEPDYYAIEFVDNAGCNQTKGSYIQLVASCRNTQDGLKGQLYDLNFILPTQVGHYIQLAEIGPKYPKFHHQSQGDGAYLDAITFSYSR